MIIDSYQLALYVNAVIKRAEQGNPLAIETLQQWDEMNQEDNLPPMRVLLEEWEKEHNGLDPVKNNPPSNFAKR